VKETAGVDLLATRTFGGKKGDAWTFGLCTQDFSVVFDLVTVLNDRGIGFVMMAPGEIVERHIDAAIVQGRSAVFVRSDPVVLRPLKDPGNTVDRAVAMVMGVFEPRKMVLGIDPGLRIGIAVIADGIVIDASFTMEPSRVLARLRDAKKALRPRHVLVRIGNGDPKRRDSIIAILKKTKVRIEIVDERSTSRQVRNAHQDAAVRIGRMSGRPISEGDIG